MLVAGGLEAKARILSRPSAATSRNRSVSAGRQRPIPSAASTRSPVATASQPRGGVAVGPPKPTWRVVQRPGRDVDFSRPGAILRILLGDSPSQSPFGHRQRRLPHQPSGSPERRQVHQLHLAFAVRPQPPAADLTLRSRRTRTRSRPGSRGRSRVSDPPATVLAILWQAERRRDRHMDRRSWLAGRLGA